MSKISPNPEERKNTFLLAESPDEDRVVAQLFFLGKDFWREVRLYDNPVRGQAVLDQHRATEVTGRDVTRHLLLPRSQRTMRSQHRATTLVWRRES